MSGTKGKGELVPQKHGGALKRGGNAGNVGGSGPPPSVVRDALRKAYNERIPRLLEIADGAPMQKAYWKLKSILRGLAADKCRNCGEPFPLHDEEGEIQIEVSASIKEQLAALDQMARYGLGFTKELTTDTVRGKLVATIALVRDTLPPDQAEALLDGMREIWR